ncbi:MAG: non-ribosomal peptide synthetase, partial [Chloroflexi bacterium]
MPIGHPIANTEIYLLDEQLQPAPIGVPAELYIGGVNLARAYLKRADLTAERFVPHPFAGRGPQAETGPVPEGGARLYRTGDVARYRPDGAIEYLGRIDQQVKLRGVRIELGEIEAVLLQHPEIREGVVQMREDEQGEKRLVTYVVGVQANAETAGELRSYLQEQLPPYMVPAFFVFLDALPLTSNGKVDFQALPDPDRSQFLKNTEAMPLGRPQTPLQEQLALMWAELLHLPQVGIHDNFFELGGHSLLAVQLLNRMNKQFGSWRKAHRLPAISLTTLFQVPTIEQVATLLQTSLRSLHLSPLVTLQPVEQTHRLEARPPLFCVHEGAGNVSSFLRLVKHLCHDRPYYGIQAPALVTTGDEGRFNSIEQIATTYINELLAVQPPNAPFFLIGYSFGGLVAFEMARQLEQQGHAVALLAILDTHPEQQDRAVGVEEELLSTVEEDCAQRILEIAEAMVRSGKKEALFPYEELRRLQPDEQLAYALAQLIEAQAVPEDMDISQFRRYTQVYEMHEICFRRYRPKPYAGRITLFRSEGREAADPSLWAPFSAEAVEVYNVSGDHNSMVAEP